MLRRYLVAFSLLLFANVSTSQSTVVNTGSSGVSGFIYHRSLVADSAGATVVMAGLSPSGTERASVLRYSAAGSLTAVESSSEWSTESFHVQSAAVDPQGRYAYAGTIKVSGVNHLVLRASSLGSGASGGIFVDLGVSGSPDSFVEVIPAADSSLWLVATAGQQPGGRLRYVRKDSGAVSFTQSTQAFGEFHELTTNSKGVILVKSYRRSGVGGLGDFYHVVAYDKNFTKLWERQNLINTPAPNGEFIYEFFNAMSLSADALYLVWDRDDYSVYPPVLTKRLERVDPLTGLVINQVSMPDPEYLQSVAMRILDDASLVMVESGQAQSRVTKFNPALAQIFSTPVTWTTIGGNAHAAIDRAGNSIISGSDRRSIGISSTKVLYVDNTGQLRWTQTLESTQSSKEFLAISASPNGDVYTTRTDSSVSTQWKITRLEPAVFLPLTADSRQANTVVLYRKFDGAEIRLHRVGPNTQSMTIRHGSGFSPISVHTTSNGSSVALFAGTASGSGRFYFVPPNSQVPSSTTDFSLPANSGSLRDIAMDTSSRVWVLSQVTIGSSTYAKYHRIGNGGVMDLTRTILIGGLGSGVKCFDTVGLWFRFGSNLPQTMGIDSRVQGAYNDGTFFGEISVPNRAQLGIADVRMTSNGTSLALLSDFFGAAPGALVKVDPNLLIVQENVTLPYSLSQEPIGIGDGQTNGVRLTWREVGGKVFLRTYNSGSFSLPTTIQALMN